MIQKILSNEELLIAPRQQINFERDQKRGRDGLLGHVGAAVSRSAVCFFIATHELKSTKLV